MKQIQQKQSQSGRSMVEILGVLAIIGVLSVGGITGYRYAMDKHAANEILNFINIAAVEVANQIQQMGPLGNDEIYETVKVNTNSFIWQNGNAVKEQSLVYNSIENDSFVINCEKLGSRLNNDFVSKNLRSKEVCQMVLEQIISPYAISWNDERQAQVYSTPLSPEEAKTICDKTFCNYNNLICSQPHILFIFKNDLS